MVYAIILQDETVTKCVNVLHSLTDNNRMTCKQTSMNIKLMNYLDGCSFKCCH